MKKKKTRRQRGKFVTLASRHLLAPLCAASRAVSQHDTETAAAKLSGLPSGSGARSKTAPPHPYPPRTPAPLKTRGVVCPRAAARAPTGPAHLHAEQLLLILPPFGPWQSSPNLQLASCNALPRGLIAATLSRPQKEVGVCGLLYELLPPNTAA